MSYLVALIVLVGAYLVGSFPTGYIAAYLGGISDIRKHGSGNIGATNVARTLGRSYFIPVFLIDAAKAAVYLMAVRACGWHESFVALSALALLFGNGYSLFLNFTGGKGFATSIGLLYVLDPYIVLILAPVWIVTFVITHTVGVASATACASLVVCAYYVIPSHVVSCTCIMMGLWGIGRHKDNLKRYALATYGW